MSPVTHLTILALASAALASPHAHGHKHRRHQELHATGGSPAGYGSASGTGAVPFPYPTGNGTQGWGSTGLPYGTPSAPAYASSSQASPNTATEYNTHTKTAYTTVHLAYQSAASGAGSSSVAAAGYGSGAAADSCAAVTVTSTEQVTQYVTEGHASSTSEAAPSYSSASPSSRTEGSPVESSTTSYSAPPSYKQESSSSSAPVLTATNAVKQQNGAPRYGSSSVPAYSSSAPAPAYGSSSATKSVASSTMGNTASTSSAAASSSGGKRGLAYNDASLTDCFSGSKEISWAYNWGSSAGDLNSAFTFIPTLWGTASEFTGPWNDNAKKAIESGSTHLFSFNEPDHTAQANLGASAAAEAYTTYMNPFKDQAKLCAPSVTNGGGDMGLTWLKSFLSACGSECHIDCINIHWYDSASNVNYFKSHIEDAIEIADGKPIYVSEFGASGSDDEIAAFLKEVMPWMDSNSNIAGYSYFMVSDGKLNSGTEPSTYGNLYKTYTS